ncbi:polysaccharide deacetylase [Persephonella atlantica]|uniref:Polysaccharide deacetylase n=1 Tax=Persephonella atlantica TaxID=2699429 RepID=A0ABS1GHE4_9AQUI|nr:endo alpha-1,4 polygalactosaminidase [Persephonella atlantica]MBK3332332.1 polysaccharide deacetylase [Persephonella atlantica]
MRRLCFSKILLLILAGFVYGKEPDSVCFYYHHNPPEEMFYLCDWVVLDQDNPPFDKKYSKVFGYVSLEEGETYRNYYKKIKKDWILGKNKFWKTVVLDLRKKEYQDFLIRDVFSKMERFDGFFLDTIDSYQLVLNRKDWKSYEKAVVQFIKRLKKRFPDKKIVINRGFEIFEQVKNYIDGFTVESLFRGINVEGKGEYIKVPSEERKWLIRRLEKIKKAGLPVIVIDYLPPDRREEAVKLAEKIKSMGFIPWIADRELSSFGVSTFNFIPRKILLIYDSSVCEDVVDCSVHRLASLIVEYLGFVPDLKDINDLPDGYTVDRYAGIIVWTEKDVVENYRRFYRWILSKIREGNKVLFLGSFGFPRDDSFLMPLGLYSEKNKALPLSPVKLIKKSRIFDFEAEPSVQPSDRLIKLISGKPLLIAKNSAGQEFVPAAVTQWGGYLIDGTVLRQEVDDLWAVNPFKLFKKALRLPDIPAPDTTTENGNRILFVHIDGDGFMERAEWDQNLFASQVLEEEIFKVFDIPHTVSVIEGEIAPWGLYPELSDKLESIARQIFSLSNVEAGSHTFSHPFKWKKLYRGEYKKGYNLPIKNYRFSLEREIKGSVDYINKRLLPEGKKVKVFQWSGDCLPPWQAVAMTYKMGLLNINGGDTTITNEHPYLSYISPMGINRNGYFQVYAAVQNENIYTNEWTGPYYGYINVIQTFKLTENPRRLKPINVYYHFYSGSKTASLNALKRVYKWALSQKVTPMYTSQWIRRVLDFRNVAVGYDEAGYIIRTDGSIRTLRIDRLLYPDMNVSRGIVGFKEEKGKVYIHLDGSGRYYLKLTEKRNREIPHIVDFNGLIRKHNKNSLTLYSYIKPELTVYLPEKCFLKAEDVEQQEKKGNYLHLTFRKKGELNIEWKCR